MMELCKAFVDPTGVEMIDKIISGIPLYTNAIGSNDATTLHRILRETQKFVDTIPSHITHDQFRKLAIERLDAFNSIVDCIHEGKCGCRAYIHYVCDNIIHLQQIYTLHSDSVALH